MACLFPRTIVNKRYTSTLPLRPGDPIPPDYYVTIGCGRCPECRRKYASAWRLRLLFEGRSSTAGIFCTFTFDDAHIPPSTTTRKEMAEIWRRFKDRLRKRTGVKKLRYFVVSDVGKKRGRYHLHAILFCNAFKTKRISYDDIRSCWNEGYVWIGNRFDIKSFNYITKYVCKSSHADPSFLPCVLCSPGLGLRHVAEHYSREFFQTHGVFNLAGFVYAIPSYFRRKFLDPLELLHLSWRRALMGNRSSPLRIGRETYSTQEAYDAAAADFRLRLQRFPQYLPKQELGRRFIKNMTQHAILF